MLLLILAQVATAQALPDIQLDVRVSARDVRIERSGETSLEVRGGPGSDVRVDTPAASGRQRLRNVNVSVQAEARVSDPQQAESADPQQNPQEPETAEPQ